MKRFSVGFLAGAAVLALASPALASDVIVQGTTDVRDAGLLTDVIIPGFQAAYPQYTLKYIAVGTGQALANAQAGQGDAVLTHAPTLEDQFVSSGFSNEPFGRAIFYSDYVIDSPASDPAGVLAGANHDAVHAFELIAAAGAAGKADFVSRGDNSGTNVQEKIIWSLTSGVPLNAAGEPTGSWYHKAGLGQAATVQLTAQCPFSSHTCYNMTDRGTFNRLMLLGTVTTLKVVAEKNDTTARGGQNLLVNSFHAYAVNPGKFPSVNLAGATAFLDYLTSPALQALLATYPSAANPAFFADARPKTSIDIHPAATTAAGGKLHFGGNALMLLPGAESLTGGAVSLVRLVAGNEKIVATTTLDATNQYRFTIPATRNAAYRIDVAAVKDLRASSVGYGIARVQAKVSSLKAKVVGRRVAVTATLAPGTDHVKAHALIQARKGSGAFTTRTSVAIPNGRAKLASSIRLTAGKWQLRVVYTDSGVVEKGTSRVIRFSVR